MKRAVLALLVVITLLASSVACCCTTVAASPPDSITGEAPRCCCRQETDQPTPKPRTDCSCKHKQPYLSTISSGNALTQALLADSCCCIDAFAPGNPDSAVIASSEAPSHLELGSLTALERLRALPVLRL
jgi:hypothetical protein